MNKTELLDSLKRSQQTLLEATELDSIPQELREELLETADGVEQLIDLI